MIRGYVAVLSRDFPLPDVSRLISSCRKATIRLVLDEGIREFSINIEGTEYCFKVPGNVRTVDRRNTASGVLRVGFISPNLDLVIYGNTEDLEAFVYTVEAVKEPTLPPPPKCCGGTHMANFSCICEGRKFKQYRQYHNDLDCQFSVSKEMCAFCCYSLLESYNDDDARKILNTWKSKICILVPFTDKRNMNSISVTSYPYLTNLTAVGQDLVEIPKQLGSLPRLVYLNLLSNELGQATNWKWLTSPFLKENLVTLMLSDNDLSVIPEPVVKLRNLKKLVVSWNSLTEIPAALGNLKNLRELDISYNELRILPGWMYRKVCFHSLTTVGNYFDLLHSTEYRKPQLNAKDFESVPSLFNTAVKYIITEGLEFWEYNIPSKLAGLLEAAYLCRCGSVVFPNMKTDHVVKCQIKVDALADLYDGDSADAVGIVFPLCSYKCYKLAEPLMID